MSVVPPSPPWAITRTLLFSSPAFSALTLSAAAMPVPDRSGVAEQRMDPRQLPRRFRVGRREHLEAAGGVGGDELVAGGAHRRVDGIARAERLAAALARPVAGVERIVSLDRRLDGALLGREQAIADGEGAGLIELDGWFIQATFAATGPDVAQQVLGDRAAAAHLRLALELAVDDSPVEIEEGERLELVGDRLAQHAFERRLGDRASAQAGDDRVAVQGAGPRGRGGHRSRRRRRGRRKSSSRRRRRATRPCSAARTAASGNGRYDWMPSTPILTPLSRRASIVSFRVPITEPRATRSSPRPRTGSRARAARVSPEARRELGGDLRDALERRDLLRVREVADLHEGLRPDHRADRDRIGRIEHLARLVRRQEGVDVGLVGNVDALVGVGEDEAVHAHHHRHRELLGQPERLDVQVERLLVRLGEELQPAAVALAHRIAVVVPDVDRRTDRPVGDRHHDRQAETRGVVDRLGHEEQALARRGRCRSWRRSPTSRSRRSSRRTRSRR
jgi:hypothetical protein